MTTLEKVLDGCSLSELRQLTKQWQSSLEKSQVWLLEGGLGAGKTEIVKGLLDGLSEQTVTSPTFSIYNIYPTHRDFEVAHVDLYRLEDEDDLESTGFWDLFASPNRAVLIEWAQRLDDNIWPPGWKMIHIRIEKNIDDSDLRNVKVKGLT